MVAALSGTPVVFGTPNDLSTASASTTLASTTVNDVGYAWLTATNNTGTPPAMSAAPTNWVLLGTYTDPSGTNANIGWLYRRVIGSSEPTALTWTLTTNSNIKGVHWCASGVDPTTPELAVSVDVHAGAGASRTTNTLSTSATGVVWSGFADRSGSTFTSPSPADTLVGSGLNSAATSVYVQYSVTTVASGTVAARTITGASTSIGGSFILATKEAPPPAGNAPAEVAAVTVAAGNARVAVSPLYEQLFTKGFPVWAHRGGSVDWVEMTADAYQHVDALHMPLREVSFWFTNDFVPVASHDRNLLRMFGVDLDITTVSWAQVQAATTAGTLTGGFPVARVDDLINASPTSYVWMIENKRDLNNTEFLDFLDGFTNSRGRFVIKGPYNSAAATLGYARGYNSWGFYYSADLPNLDSTYTNFTWLGMDYTASQADWDTILAKGKPVWGHVCLTLANMTTAYGKGATGVITGKILNAAPFAPATAASITGTALDAIAATAVSASAGTAAVTAAALDASVVIGARVDAPATVAAVTGLALDASVAVAEAVRRGSWGTLLAIVAEAREAARDELIGTPVACPNDGEPLRSGPRGGLYCLWGDYSWQLPGSFM